MDSSEIYRMIEDKKVEMSPVFNRMAIDEDLYFLTPYEMRMLPPYENKKMPEVANVTLNEPLLFAQKAIAITSGTTRQTVVEGQDITDKQSTMIENFLDDLFYSVDDWLNKRGILSLDGFIHEQIHIRGRIVARCCMRLGEDNRLIPDVLPIDANSFIYENGTDGMIWGAGIYNRSRARIEQEYGCNINEDYADVIEYYDNEQNIVFVGRDAVKQQPNPYKYPPFVLSLCPVGSMLNSSNAAEHTGESIFWANRNLWDELNRTATIMQTLNVNSVFGALQYESTKGETAPKPETSPYRQRTVHPVEKGGGYKPMPVSDIKSATRLFYSVLETCLQRGSLSAVDYGTLTFPLSAVAISRLSASRDDILLPRLNAIAVFYQALSKMIINQCIAIGKKVKLGEYGNAYSVSDMKGDYAIKYRFFVQSKEQDAADLSIASAAQGFLSSDTIRREILRLKDPDGEEAKFLSEQAEKADEVLFLYRRASKLIEDGKPLEAYILAQRIVTILKQRQMSSTMVEAAPAQKQTQAKQVLPLLSGGEQSGNRSVKQGDMPIVSAQQEELTKEEAVNE